MECASKICQIAKQERMTWMKSTVQNNSLKSLLVDYAKLCQCDIRKILNEMQLFASSMNITSELKKSTQDESQIELDDVETLGPALKASVIAGYPSISSISPRTVSSTYRTMLTITGTNFLSLKSSGCVQILIGEQKLSNVQVLDDKTVTAVTSKVELPSLVEVYVAKSLRYVPVIFRVSNMKGETMFTSDSCMCTLNGEGFYSCVPNIEYIFPESSCGMEARSKAHIEKRRHREKFQRIDDHNIVEGYSLVFSEGSEHGSCGSFTMDSHMGPSSCSYPSESYSSQVHNLATCESKTDDVKNAYFMKNAVCEGLQTVNYGAEHPVIITPSSQESVKGKIECNFDSYLQISLEESDIQYLKDSIDIVGLPIVSGPVVGLSLQDSGEDGSEKL